MAGGAPIAANLAHTADAPAAGSVISSLPAAPALDASLTSAQGDQSVATAPVDESIDQQPSSNISADTAASAASPLDSIRTYAVQAGDSVRTIAKQFGVSNETIIWENDLSEPDALQVGQQLRILPFSGLVHQVRPGDTVASIASGYDAKVDEVISANKLAAPYVILVGQKLLVPGGYRALPSKPLPPALVPVPAAAPPADTVQAPASQDSLQAATAPTPARPLFPVLGNTPQEQFISSIGPAAVQSQQATGVPASVTIAQAILESYWGSSRLSTEDNNYFGIKAQTKAGPAGVVWLSTWEVINGRNIQESQPFRAYHTMVESFIDHGQFFTENARYATAMADRGDAKQFAIDINRAGYATDPSYASKLIALMDRYNLYAWDKV